MFDITKTDGIWLATEDKRFYKMQIKSQGEVGYSQQQYKLKCIHQKLSKEIPQAVVHVIFLLQIEM